MPLLISPLESPADWSLSWAARSLPAGARYPGRRVPVVAGGPASARVVSAPAAGIARVLSDPAGTVVELEPNPFLLHAVLREVGLGLPSFYIGFPGLSPADLPSGGSVWPMPTAITTVPAGGSIWVGIAGQDGVFRDLAAWADRLLAALITVGDPEAASWSAFSDRVAAAVGGERKPVLLLDHTGGPLAQARIDVATAATRFEVELLPDHDGNLQRAIEAGGRPGLWSGGTNFATVRRVGVPEGAPPNAHWVNFELGTAAAGTTPVQPNHTHLQSALLHDWFAPQQAGVTSAAPLRRYTAGNRLRPFISGYDFFDDLVREVRGLSGANDSANFAGWQFKHEFALMAPSDRELTFIELMQEADARQVTSRFLVNQFINFDTPTIPITAALMIVLFMELLVGLDVEAGVDFWDSDGAGLATLVVLALLITGYATYVVITDGRPLEKSKDSQPALDALDHGRAVWSANPATVADNPIASGVPSHLPGVTHFGAYHQKLIVLHRGANLVAYAGGMDIAPNRRDDARRVSRATFHDVQMRVDGPAAEDLGQTLAARWGHETAETYAVPAIQPSGPEIVQVARTYPRSAEPARQLPFAPGGDFTYAETVIAAIAQARDYIYIEDQYFTPPERMQAALLAALGRVKRLIVLMPRENDQYLGDPTRRRAVIDLIAAAADAGTPEKVIAGAPMARFRLRPSGRRAGFGRCLLLTAMGAPVTGESIVLGPELRATIKPPFWLSIDGELMLATEALPPGLDPADAKGKRFRVVRGADLGIETTPRQHDAGAAATVVHYPGIYVHSKVVVIDDHFAAVGTANINRRGFFHDGEVHVFSATEQLRRDPDNFARRLRVELWSALLDLPLPIARSLLADPIRGSELFRRSFRVGNRFIPHDFWPVEPTLNLSPKPATWAFVLASMGVALAAAEEREIFDTAIDPTTSEP